MTWDIAPPKRWIYETVSYDEGWLAKVTFIGAYVDQVFDELLGLADGLAVSRFTFIAANDYRTRYKINEGIDKYFHDDDYSPKPEDDDYAVILARREVVCDFLFRRAHLKKEVLRTLGCACSRVGDRVGSLRCLTNPRISVDGNWRNWGCAHGPLADRRALSP